jgi:hypothetical protein
MTRAARAVGTCQRPVDGGAGAVAQLAFELGEHVGDDGARRGTRLVRQQVVELDQQRDEMEIRLDRRQQFGFEQQLPQVEPLDRVALHHLDDFAWEVAADVAEPAGDARCAAPEPARPPRPASAGTALRGPRHVVHRAERGVDPDVVTPQLDVGAVGIAATEHQPPPVETFPLRDASDRHVGSSHTPLWRREAAPPGRFRAA